MTELKRCPFCGKNAVYIGVCDDEDNFHGHLGCEYEQDPWSGLFYDLHHEGWGQMYPLHGWRQSKHGWCTV